MGDTERRARLDVVLGVAMAGLRWAGRLVRLLAVVVAVAGLVDAALVAAVAPAGVAVGVAAVALLAAALLTLYRRRLREVADGEDDLRDALTGAWVTGEPGRRLNEDLLPRIRGGPRLGRLRALWQAVGIVRDHSPVRAVRDGLDAVAGGAALLPYAAVLAAVLVAAVPVLAVVALVA
ncbi:MAG TPA: hypothetical protein VGB14_17960 [Acidimicrobiales bacterium]|jgi:hypothetical protein